MKAHVTVTDDAGNTFEGEIDLAVVGKASIGKTKTRGVPKAVSLTPAKKEPVNLSSPIRPFVKKHAGKMTGPQKFTLILAHMVGGDTGKEVLRADVEKQWNKMTALVGGEFNSAYANRAKDQGWVDSRKKGVYKLLPDWRDIFRNA